MYVLGDEGRHSGIRNTCSVHSTLLEPGTLRTKNLALLSHTLTGALASKLTVTE